MPPYSLLKSVAVGLCMAFFVAACATTPDTFSSSAPGKDFSTIKTFGFLSQPSTDQPGYESLETNFLKVAVAQEMDRRGVRYDPMNPDVLMNFYIRTEQKIKSRQVPSASGGYYGYRSGFYGGYAGYETHIEQYTGVRDGSLAVRTIRSGLRWYRQRSLCCR